MCQEQTVARLRPALGTLVAIESRSQGTASAERPLEAGFEAIRAVERRLHPSRAGSDLARLNGARAGTQIRVHASTVAILQLSRRLCVASGGRFDPALPGHGSILGWIPVGVHSVVIRRRAHVDLGGIGKGFAVDLAVAAMRRAGAHSGLVNAGGDLRVFGRQRWTTWLRGVDGALRELVLRDCALAASDPGARDSPPEHRGYYAGGGAAGRGPASRAARQPRAGRCAVLAPCAALADGLTKVVMHASPAQAAVILSEFHARTIARYETIVAST